MKTITKLFLVLLLAFGIKANAQITLLNTFPRSNYIGGFQAVYLRHSGYKFANLHSDTLSFYNINLSLYKNVIIPGNWPVGVFKVQCISEGLFDTDTLHIDYMVQNSATSDSIVIYKDNGTVVFKLDSAIFLAGYNPGMDESYFYPIINTDSGTFMAVVLVSNSTNQLYKLPGSLPCIPNCSSGNFTTSMPIISSTQNGTMSIYPNPAVSYTNIYYSLPSGTNQGELVLYDLAGRELKKYTVTSQADHLRLTTSDIAAGTYFYQLMVNGNGIAAKKIVVVK